MRKLLVMITFIGICFVAKATTDGYKITGKASGTKKATAYLITFSNYVADTIGRAEVADGVFEFKGKVHEILPALLFLSNQSMGGVPVYLENEDYQIEIDPDYIYFSAIKGGGEAQRLSNEYRDIEIKGREQTEKYRDEFVSLKPGDARFQELSLKFDSINQKIRSDRETFMKKHADSYLALDFLAAGAQKKELEELKDEYSKFSSELQKSFAGRNISDWIAKQEKAGIGKKAPDFTVFDPKGEKFNFYSVKAKVKLIDFWASWCSPCRAMVPELKEIYKEFHDKGLEIVSISMDKKRDYWLKALEEEAMPWVHGCDFKGNETMDIPLMKAYAFWGVPYMVLVDEHNRIISRASGANQLPEIRSVLLDILGK